MISAVLTMTTMRIGSSGKLAGNVSKQGQAHGDMTAYVTYARASSRVGRLRPPSPDFSCCELGSSGVSRFSGRLLRRRRSGIGRESEIVASILGTLRQVRLIEYSN